MTNSYSEDILVEQPAIALFDTLEWRMGNGELLSRGLRSPHPGPLPEGEGECLLSPGDEQRGRAGRPAAANREIYRLSKDPDWLVNADVFYGRASVV